ncbi:MAG: hypothetical protein U0893_00455 [Chloroflexota bacterium]
MSENRPPHLIHPDGVDAWLADSAVRVVTYHNTDQRSAAAILRDGVSINRSWTGSYGQGFYTASVPDPFFGEFELTTAVKLRSPMIGDAEELGPYIDRLTYRFDPVTRLLTPRVAALIRRELLSEGYDGLVVYNAGGDGTDYIIALIAESVRIVVDR